MGSNLLMLLVGFGKGYEVIKSSRLRLLRFIIRSIILTLSLCFVLIRRDVLGVGRMWMLLICVFIFFYVRKKRKGLRTRLK